MTKIIIGIHGLSNKPEKSQLKEWWKAAMLEGLEKNAGISLSELPFESIYWADVTYPQHDPNPDAYRTAEPGALKRYDDGWLDIVKNKFRDIGGDTIDLAKKAGGIGIWSYAPAEETVYWDATNQDLHGLEITGDEGRFEDWEATVHPDDRARVKAEFADAPVGMHDAVLGVEL